MSEHIKADLHLHTHYSVDSLTKVDRLIRTGKERGLGKIAVTDHNEIQGALEAQVLAPDYVIVGEEVMSTSGEILGYFLQERIPARLSPRETIERMREQNAFISIPHPFDPFRSDWKREELIELAPFVDAVEGFNARCFTRRMNSMAQDFAKAQGLAMTAGSDGHWHREAGNAYLVLPDFFSADELRSAIRHARIGGKRAPFWVRFYSSYVRLRKLIRQST